MSDITNFRKHRTMSEDIIKKARNTTFILNKKNMVISIPAPTKDIRQWLSVIGSLLYS